MKHRDYLSDKKDYPSETKGLSNWIIDFSQVKNRVHLSEDMEYPNENMYYLSKGKNYPSKA